MERTGEGRGSWDKGSYAGNSGKLYTPLNQIPCNAGGRRTPERVSLSEALTAVAAWGTATCQLDDGHPMDSMEYKQIVLYIYICG